MASWSPQAAASRWRCRSRLLVLCLALVVVLSCSLAGGLSVPSRRTTPPAAAGRTRYTVVADLNDGPSERAQQQRSSMPRATEEHLAAAAAAREYALAYVARMHSSDQDGARPPTHHAASGYDLLARRQEKARQVKQSAQRKRKQKQRKAAPSSSAGEYDFAESGASFLEEQVRLNAQQGYDKYSDSDSPPAWLVPEADAKQGCPTTKPPGVPRMLPPPPPQPTPTWMSPFAEHNTPVFPQSSTPAPFYGMGTPPPSPPGNYLPLDTFLSPAPPDDAASFR